MKNALDHLLELDVYKDFIAEVNSINFIKSESINDKDFIDQSYCLIASASVKDVQVVTIDSYSELEDLEMVNKINFNFYTLNKSEATQLRDYLNKFLEKGAK